MKKRRDAMRIAIISDLHIGDENCKLIGGNSSTTDTYDVFKSTIRDFTDGGSLDYLVLNGDVLDFSINSFESSCIMAVPFFRALAKDAIAKEIIYIPGNHDKHIWDAVEWETNIIRRLKEHKEPRRLRRTQPGVIDFTLDSYSPLKLHGVCPLLKEQRDMEHCLLRVCLRRITSCL
jgi:DNA repair exonuclease SbcCD nuclease subunit